MNVARWAVWTLMALAALSALPFRHGGPLAAVRWGLAAAATVLFVLWLWAGARAIGRAVRGRPAQGTWPARVGGVVSGAVPWLLAVSLIAGRCAAVRATRPAVTPEREEAARRMERCIRVLACEIGERHALGRLEALQRAGNWIESEFTASGWQVRREVFEIPSAGGIVEVANLIAERRGRVRPGEIVLVGAHYDTAPGTPGANDNASGVAALLELAWRWRALEPDRTLRLVAFTNEEPPWFMTSHMGSEVYAAGIAARGERVVLMVALETIGCFRNERGSQEYPSPLFYLWFPDRGNFIALVGSWRSAAKIGSVAAAMQRATDVPVRWAALPLWVSGVSWSDHWPFARRGMPAFMVTDTAPYRYRWYHEPEDLPDRLDVHAMAAVVDGVEAALRQQVEVPSSTKR